MISLGFEVVCVGLWCFVMWFVVFCVGLWCFVMWFVVFCGVLWCLVPPVVSARYFLMLRVHLKILKNIQQIKELQTAYENRKQFTISLNGTYAKL